ncbi:hypothetical protein [Anatilimnocola floriformis]|uniref:hypothetical protein n=1 Tax=Anatilimnocola floriformis TaxID=2948575 RepID=UPI0020C302AA|nr:hypothetical protein [Anatilimnocola floriformis]
MAAAAAAQDAGPGPSGDATSKQYDVVVVRAGSLSQGVLVFTRAGDNSGVPTDGNDIDESLPTTNDASADGTNPVASGDFGNVGNPNGATGNTAGNTSGSVNQNMTTTPATGTTNTTGTATATGEAAAAQPASYWTTARANGQVASQTNDANSADYWTTARARGEGNADVSVGAANGNGSGQAPSSVLTTGGFMADFADETSMGTWYSINLGGFALWYATSESTESPVSYVGYSTAETIFGYTAAGTGGMMETMFAGSFFMGTATDDVDPASDTQ